MACSNCKKKAKRRIQSLAKASAIRKGKPFKINIKGKTYNATPRT